MGSEMVEKTAVQMVQSMADMSAAWWVGWMVACWVVTMAASMDSTSVQQSALMLADSMAGYWVVKWVLQTADS